MNKGSYNKVVLLGHLGDDPEVKYTTGGSAVTNLSLATNESWKGADGELKEKTEWHRIVVFGKRAETAGEWLKKGQLLLVEGKLQTRSWEDKDGVKRYSTEVICENFVMMGKKGDGSPASTSTKKTTEQDDDLPF